MLLQYPPGFYILKETIQPCLFFSASNTTSPGTCPAQLLKQRDCQVSFYFSRSVALRLSIAHPHLSIATAFENTWAQKDTYRKTASIKQHNLQEMTLMTA